MMQYFNVHHTTCTCLYNSLKYLVPYCNVIVFKESKCDPITSYCLQIPLKVPDLFCAALWLSLTLVL